MDAYRLAEMVGTVQVEELLDTLSRRQFRKWQAYFRVKEYEQWNIAAHIVEAVWNVVVLCSDLTEDSKRTSVKTPADTLRSWGRELKRKRRTAPKPKAEAAGDGVLAKIAAKLGPKT